MIPDFLPVLKKVIFWNIYFMVKCFCIVFQMDHWRFSVFKIDPKCVCVCVGSGGGEKNTVEISMDIN